jgi:hypothetical protein
MIKSPKSQSTTRAMAPKTGIVFLASGGVSKYSNNKQK